LCEDVGIVFRAHWRGPGHAERVLAGQ
jgi:hypothetical protein